MKLTIPERFQFSPSFAASFLIILSATAAPAAAQAIPAFPLNTLKVRNSSFNGENGYFFGTVSFDRAAVIGDVNADGINDYVGLSGVTAYLVYGADTKGSFGAFDMGNFSVADGVRILADFVGNDPFESVAGVGDVNMDGLPDFILGSPSSNVGAIFDAGKAYLIFASAGLIANSNFLVANIDATTGLTFHGAANTGKVGFDVSAAGDFNQDGIADILISEPYYNNSTGRVYLVRGSASIGSATPMVLSPATMTGSNGFVMNGQLTSDVTGFSVSNIGDVNADGKADILINTRRANGGSGVLGKAYVVYGGASVGSSGSLNLSSLFGPNGFQINGQSLNDDFGYDGSGVGDINNTGVVDFAISSPQFKIFPGGGGAVYVMYGSSAIAASGVLNVAALNGVRGFRIGAATEFDNLIGLCNSGDVNEDGMSDIVISATGMFGPSSSSGGLYVVFGAAGLGSANGGIYSLGAINGNNGYRFLSDNGESQLGRWFAAGHDVTGDGKVDFLLGCISPSVKTFIIKDHSKFAGEYGTGTHPDCQGLEVLSPSGSPKINSPNYRIYCNSVFPNMLGLGIVTDVGLYPGADTLGIGADLHVDIANATELLTFDFVSQAGWTTAVAGTPIPNDPFMIGKEYYIQAIFYFTPNICHPGGAYFNSSQGLKLRILP